MSRSRKLTLEILPVPAIASNGRAHVSSTAPRSRKLLHVARQAALRVARRSTLRVCTVDDVLGELESARIGPADLGGSLGNVFRTGEWEATPWRAWSTRRDGRRRLVRVWRHVGGRTRPWVNDRRAQSAW